MNALRQRTFYFVLFCLLFRLSANARADQTPRLRYEVRIANLAAKRLQIRAVLESPPLGRIAFAIPAWTPGYYQLQSYEKSLSPLHIRTAEERTLALSHPSERVWEAEVTEETASVAFTYELTAKDAGLGFFGSRLDPQQGYLNGASAFVYPVGYTNLPVALELTLPADWKVATGLTPAPDAPRSANNDTAYSFAAADYDEFIDSPIQFGQFSEANFLVENVPFRVIVVGRKIADPDALTKPLKAIAQAQYNVFGAFPFQSFLFIYHVGGAGFEGGLEHHNSTVIHTNSFDPTKDDFLTLSSHELFHAWNVKRIRPAGLGPFDYTQPVRTPSLWFAEGVTDYYGMLTVVRAGLRSKEWFLKDFALRLDDLETEANRRTVSLEESSRKTWEAEGFGFGIDYYRKGSLVGFLLDLHIRQETQGRKSLDDVLRALYQRFGEPHVGYPEDALPAAFQQATGLEFAPLFECYVKGTSDLDWVGALAANGVQLEREARPFLGITVGEGENAPNNGVALIQKVQSGFAGDAMGLQVGDVIAQVNGVPVRANTFRETLLRLPPQSVVRLDLIRDSQPLQLSGKLDAQYAKARLTWLSGSRISAEARRARATLFASQKPNAGGSP